MTKETFIHTMELLQKLPDSESDLAKAVSYTHLDVYKRQPLMRINSRNRKKDDKRRKKRDSKV